MSKKMHEFGVPNMKITFLGTGTSQGVPVIGCECDVCKSEDDRNSRLRTSILLQIGEKSIVVDTGPDFRQQMLREGIKELDAIVFTHEHKDHLAGLDDIRAYNYWQKRPMDIYANNDVEKAIRRDFHYSFDTSVQGGVPLMNIINIHRESFELGGKIWTPLPVMHADLEVLGFRIGAFAYVTDVNFISEETYEKIKGVKTLVISALRRFKHPSHYSLPEVLDVIEKISPNAAYLTHMSHLIGLHEELEEELPAGIYPAFDGLKIEIK
tara:strand:+ start:4750 stop:5550 length:801 start_codon:yes stop_codon:yes gene_type:complete